MRNEGHTTLPILDRRHDHEDDDAIERELSCLPGVRRIFVNRLSETVYVEYDPTRCSRQHLRAALGRIGCGGNAA